MTWSHHPLSRVSVGLLLAVCALSAWAREGQPLVVQNLTTMNGLPQGTVMASLQDSKGFVWLGTQDGLVRFDGHDVHRYASSANSDGGLPGNFVNALAEDAAGDIWIGIKGGGVARWDRSTDRFTAYRHNPANAQTLSSDAVRTVIVDRDGAIWAGTFDAGLNRLDPASGAVRRFTHDDSRAGSLQGNQVQALLQDRSGQLLVGTQQGLDVWSPASSEFIHYRLPAGPGNASNTRVSSIAEDAAGTLWIGTFDDGLHELDSKGRLLRSYRHRADDSASLISNDVRAILDDHAGHLWVGTPEGLELLDRDKHIFTHYGHDQADPNSLTESYVMSLSRDRTGLVWIGQRAGGVSRWNPRSWEFGGQRPDTLEGRHVTSFADAGEQRIWIGTMGGGLFRFDPATGNTLNIDVILGRKNVLTDKRVMSLHRDRQGTLWVGTMSAGLLRLTDDKVSAIKVAKGEPSSLSDGGIMSLYESSSGDLWIGTHDGGANVMNPVTGAIRQLPFGTSTPNAVSSQAVTSFAEDRNGNMWIGTENGGLNLADAKGNVLKVFRHSRADPDSLASDTTYSITSDQNGDVWVATDGAGLDRIDGSSSEPEAIRFAHLTGTDGLSSETLYGVLPDSKGSLWMSGNAGLMRLDVATHSVKSYHREHGLQGEEFNFGAYFKTADGRLCFGGPGGFNVFDPANLSESQDSPRLALMQLEVLGVPVKSPLPSWRLAHVDLAHGDNIVSFDFAALDFTSPARNRIAYRMPGLTDRWIDLGSQRRVTLTNLDAGDHVLEVRAANADLNWSPEPLRLRIHKSPAPWASPWAYGCYTLMFGVMITLLVRAQRRKLQTALAAQHRLESQVELRTQELRETNRQLVEASEAKSSFLARMGHELRTPMNGVVGMTELLSKSPLSPLQTRQTRTIRSSAQALLQILNDLLDLSKIQAKKVVLESLPFDVTQLIEECAALFDGAAAAKGLRLVVCPPASDPTLLLGDPLRLRQILLNLIGNAIKFTDQGEVVVRCDLERTAPDHAEATFCIQDTGIGLSQSAIEKIFEPFTQGDETTTRRFGGTGLGLAICRELADLMGAKIAVESAPRIGSTFRMPVRLAIGSARDVACDPTVRGRSIGIVSQQRSTFEALRRYLLQLGFAPTLIEPARLGGTAGTVDAVLMDADERSGALARLPGLAATVPCLYAIRESSQLEALLAIGIDERSVLRKPVQRDDLRDAMHRLMGLATGALPAIDSVRAKLDAHVLIVEDDTVNSAVAEGYVAELGCTCAVVSNGAAAVARSATEAFDLIFMDLNMPGLDGHAATALIRQREGEASRIPIIALTANDAESYRTSCELAGMDDILSKPYTLAQCAAIIQRWVPAKYADVRSANTVQLASLDEATVAALQAIGGGTGDILYRKLTALFSDSSERDLACMRLAVRDGDREAVKSLCHKAKSAAANIGALNFSAALANLEQACPGADMSVIAVQFGDIESAHRLLLANLAKFKAREAA